MISRPRMSDAEFCDDAGQSACFPGQDFFDCWSTKKFSNWKYLKKWAIKCDFSQTQKSFIIERELEEFHARSHVLVAVPLKCPFINAVLLLDKYEYVLAAEPAKVNFIWEEIVYDKELI